ncbi:MAG TPA: hypothetical protein PKN96_08515 [Flavobacterium sp.]|uniref:hypothetical protein n=1 Tax=Flavobacterium sp. TaxID=239 RepID=UPI002D0B3A95|nr:hypothetical protein [Flavobacterium sp.]HNP33321.1 hypothetical protein [Flavobacterium sp.]
MKNKTIAIAGILILFLSSCVVANLPSEDIPHENKLEKDNGMIIGAISFEATRARDILNSYTFYYSKEKGFAWDDPKKNNIRIKPSQTVGMKFKPDFYDNDRAVYYFKIEKPQGRYIFYAFRTMRDGVQSYTYTTKELAIPFTIENGKIKYFGELNVNSFNDVRAVSKSERDLPKLKEMFPNLVIEN